MSVSAFLCQININEFYRRADRELHLEIKGSYNDGSLVEGS